MCFNKFVGVSQCVQQRDKGPGCCSEVVAIFMRFVHVFSSSGGWFIFPNHSEPSNIIGHKGCRQCEKEITTGSEC